MNELLSGRRVLVVEDEMLVLIMIEDMLADLGCKSVTAAATVDKALALINEQVFDVAMLDMNLNGNDSHVLAEALAALGIPFFYSTGNIQGGRHRACAVNEIAPDNRRDVKVGRANST